MKNSERFFHFVQNLKRAELGRFFNRNSTFKSDIGGISEQGVSLPNYICPIHKIHDDDSEFSIDNIVENNRSNDLSQENWNSIKDSHLDYPENDSIEKANHLASNHDVTNSIPFVPRLNSGEYHSIRKSILEEILRHIPYPDNFQKLVMIKLLDYNSMQELNNELLAIRKQHREVAFGYEGISVHSFSHVDSHGSEQMDTSSPKMQTSSSNMEPNTQWPAISHQYSSHDEFDSLSKSARRKFPTKEKALIDKKKKKIIQEFILKFKSEHNIPEYEVLRWSTIPLQDLRALSLETSLSRKQLRYQLEYLSSTMGKVSREKRRELRKLLQLYRMTGSFEPNESQDNLPTISDEDGFNIQLKTEDYIYLESKLGLNRFQLYSMIHYYTDRKGKLTKEKQRKLEELLQKYIDPRSGVYRPLSEDEFNKIKNDFGWSSYQLRFQIKRIREQSQWGNVSKETKDQMRSFLNLYPNPTQDQLRALQKKLHLHKDQMRQLRYRIENPFDSFSQEKKEYLRKWLEANNFQKPDTLEIEQLIQETKLSRRQIHSMISTLRDPAKELTPEKKEQVRSFIEQHGIPNKENIDVLMKEVQLGKKQLRNLITSIIDPPRDFSKEKKEIILNILSAQEFSMPTAEQKKEICSLVDLSLKQVSEHCRFIIKKMRKE